MSTDQPGVPSREPCGRIRVIAFYAAPEYRLERIPAGGRDAVPAPGPAERGRDDDMPTWLGQEIAKLRQVESSARLVRVPQLDKQLPQLITAQRLDPAAVQLNPDPQLRESAGVAGDVEVTFTGVTSYLFLLQVPVRQAVMAFEFTLDASSGETALHTLLRYLAAAELHLRSTNGVRTLTDYVQEEIQRAGWRRPPGDSTDEPYWLALERHQMVLVDDWPAAFPHDGESDALKRAIVHQMSGGVDGQLGHDESEDGNSWDRRISGGEIHRPVALNLRSEHWCGVLAGTSLIVGQHSDALLAGLCLTVVQAVGTGARFQTIWNRAFDHASTFQREYEDEPLGSHPRKALERLSDELGNLEFELAFNVGTAADLGLRIPSAPARADDFHHALYEAMELRQRVSTVGQMFIQARNSVSSELTAIESRETRAAARRSTVLDLTYGLTGLLLGGLAVMLAYLGMSTSDLQNCLTRDGVRTCNPISMHEALSLAWVHGWFWLGLAPFVLLFIPLVFRPITMYLDRRET